MLEHEKPTDQREKKKNPKFLGGEGRSYTLLCFINKNAGCEKTRKDRVQGVQGLIVNFLDLSPFLICFLVFLCSKIGWLFYPCCDFLTTSIGRSGFNKKLHVLGCEREE
jgi:hypothetical protein